MKGIIFTGGEGPPAAFSRVLAEGADCILAADSGLSAAEDAGVTPHWITGDMDSLDDVRRLEKYPPGRIKRFPRDKDYTDTELGFALLREQGCDQIWIIGGGGGRGDHFLGIVSLFERENPPERWITAKEDIFCIFCGGKTQSQRRELSLPCKTFPQVPPLSSGSLVSVFPLGEGPWEAESSGLKWPLNGLSWKRGFFGLSNVAEAGRFSISAKQGRFLVIVPNEA